jgi:hypothetical protein
MHSRITTITTLVNDSMAPKTNDLIEAHEAMAAVLDAKFPHLKEWTAFRAINRLLIASLEKPPAASARAPTGKRVRARLHEDAPVPYMTLAANALTDSKKPITTPALMEYVAAHRTITGDPKKARIVVQSSLSKDERFRSIPWESGRAWWWSDKPIPANDSPNLGVFK